MPINIIKSALRWFENLIDTWHIYTDEQKKEYVKTGIERLNEVFKYGERKEGGK